MSPRTRGERPAVGSSSSRMTGSTISALAMATIWRWPPDSVPAGARRFSASGGKSSYISSIRGRKSSVRMYAPISRFSFTLRFGKTFSVWGT